MTVENKSYAAKQAQKIADDAAAQGAELLITNAYAQSSGGVQLRVKTVTVYYAE